MRLVLAILFELYCRALLCGWLAVSALTVLIAPRFTVRKLNEQLGFVRDHDIRQANSPQSKRGRPER